MMSMRTSSINGANTNFPVYPTLERGKAITMFICVALKRSSRVLLGLHVSLAGLCYRTCWVRLRVPAHSIRCINTSWWPTGWKTTWQESTWTSWWTPSWQGTRNVSLWQRQPTSWASLGRALPETPHQMVQCWAPHHTGASPVKGHKIPLRDLRATVLWGKA